MSEQRLLSKNQGLMKPLHVYRRISLDKLSVEARLQERCFYNGKQQADDLSRLELTREFSASVSPIYKEKRQDGVERLADTLAQFIELGTLKRYAWKQAQF